MGSGRAQGFTTALTDIDTAPQEYMGMIRQEFNADYKYVRFTGTTAVAIGDVVCYVLTDNTGTSVDGANSAIGAGVATAVHALGSVTYGWVQIRGVATLSTAFGAGAAGNNVTTVGAVAPGVTTPAADTSYCVGTILNVASRIMFCSFLN